MRLSLLLLAAMLVSSSAHGFNISRGISFGSSCAEIKKVEHSAGTRIIGETRQEGRYSTYLFYSLGIGLPRSYIIYKCDGKLWSQSYSIRYSSIDELKKWQKVFVQELSNQYGKPSMFPATPWWNEIYLSIFEHELYVRKNMRRWWAVDGHEVMVEYEDCFPPSKDGSPAHCQLGIYRQTPLPTEGHIFAEHVR
ncbi:MAG: hypothetical protein PSX71_09005 [bacterium]|nr:hypothetical protein [bacterium]